MEQLWKACAENPDNCHWGYLLYSGPNTSDAVAAPFIQKAGMHGIEESRIGTLASGFIANDIVTRIITFNKDGVASIRLNGTRIATSLSALALLCQGYLAVHSDSSGNPEDVIEQDKKDVAEALVKMEHQKIFCSEASRAMLVEPLRSGSSEDRVPLRARARAKCFWKHLVVPPNGGAPSLVAYLEGVKTKEWSLLSGKRANGHEPDWDQVEGLLKLLQTAHTPGAEVGMVARAFIQLADKLGGS